MRKRKLDQKEKNFLGLADWESEVLEKASKSVSDILNEINQPVIEIFEENKKFFLSLDFETFQYEIGKLILDQYDDSRIRTLAEFELSLSDAVNNGLICFKIAYEYFHKESFGEIIGYEKMFNTKLEKSEKK